MSAGTFTTGHVGPEVVPRLLDLLRPEGLVAWVIATTHQRRGYAGEAAAAMARWLRRQGVRVLAAYVHPEHRASARVAERLGLAATEQRVDGEIRWTGAGEDRPRA